MEDQHIWTLGRSYELIVALKLPHPRDARAAIDRQTQHMDLGQQKVQVDSVMSKPKRFEDGHWFNFPAAIPQCSLGCEKDNQTFWNWWSHRPSGKIPSAEKADLKKALGVKVSTSLPKTVVKVAQHDEELISKFSEANWDEIANMYSACMIMITKKLFDDNQATLGWI